MDNTAIDRISLDDLYGEQKELAETIGLEAYRKLVKTYGGLSVYVAKADYVIRNDRDGRIIQEYTGYNAKALAAKYDLTERSILRIVAPETERLKNEPMAEQISFCDY